MALGRAVEQALDGVRGAADRALRGDDLARRLQRLIDEPDRLDRYRAAVQPPKTLQAAVDEFEAVYLDACRSCPKPI